MKIADKIFFSYSRKDSQFALQVAGKLKGAGVEVWIDQLNIKGGNHWDVDIENALNASTCIIAIISPNAIESTQVMNELAYAIEEDKRVIPILISNCKLPLLLRRLQYLNFAEDFHEGFTQLLKTLQILEKQKIFSNSSGNNELIKQGLNYPIWKYRIVLVGIIAIVICLFFYFDGRDDRQFLEGTVSRSLFF